jgi:hypothetical protein
MSFARSASTKNGSLLNRVTDWHSMNVTNFEESLCKRVERDLPVNVNQSARLIPFLRQIERLFTPTLVYLVESN